MIPCNVYVIYLIIFVQLLGIFSPRGHILTNHEPLFLQLKVIRRLNHTNSRE
jgi:hypothetical protein